MTINKSCDNCLYGMRVEEDKLCCTYAGICHTPDGDKTAWTPNKEQQCAELKEPLNAPKECAPCPPGVRNHIYMPMVHVGIVACKPVADTSDIVSVDVRTQELPKVFMLREQYDKLDPAFIRKKQEEALCILVPVERDEMDRIRQEAVVYATMPEIPKLPETLWREPSPYYGGANIGKGYKHVGGRQDPKDYAKKKKAKRRNQKQARRKNK